MILCRPGRSGVEVAWLHRAPQLRFLGDFWVFPGGRAEPEETPVQAAVRETREETGIVLDEGALIRCGHWITPPYGPVRFDTAFFLTRAPQGAALTVDGSEIDRAEWIRPNSALERWATDQALLAPPTRVTLQALAQVDGDPDTDGWHERAAAAVNASHPPGGEYEGGIDFRPGIALFLVRTPTLPPATHTNAVVVGDGDQVVVIDPASPYDEERQRLDRYLDGTGQTVREVLLTHHHPDHSSGAQYLADRLGVGIAAHARTRDILAGRVTVTRTIEDGERIELPGPRGRRLRAILTEGHADGHLVYLEETTNTLIAGDMVAGVGTIVVDPPEGKMALYLESLQRLIELDPALLFPSHGPPIGDPRQYLEYYVSHRLMREGKVLASLEDGPKDIPGLIPQAYDDKPPFIWPLAQRAALAHLLKLESEGRVVREGEHWQRVE